MTSGEYIEHNWGAPVDFDDAELGIDDPRSPLVRLVSEDIDQTRTERLALQSAIRKTLAQNEAAVEDTGSDSQETQESLQIRERGLYEDLTIRDRSRSKAQSRAIGGIASWRNR